MKKKKERKNAGHPIFTDTMSISRNVYNPRLETITTTSMCVAILFAQIPNSSSAAVDLRGSDSRRFMPTIWSPDRDALVFPVSL